MPVKPTRNVLSEDAPSCRLNRSTSRQKVTLGGEEEGKRRWHTSRKLLCDRNGLEYFQPGLQSESQASQATQETLSLLIIIIITIIFSFNLYLPRVAYTDKGKQNSILYQLPKDSQQSTKKTNLRITANCQTL